jgi:hypothetical protein
VVNAPALIPVQLTIVSADGRPHTATIKTNPPHTLTAPPGGRASTLIGGLRDGRYPITLDHRAGALALVIGGQPGP